MTEEELRELKMRSLTTASIVISAASLALLVALIVLLLMIGW